MTSKTSIAIIGAGLIGKTHINRMGLADNLQLAAIAEPTQAGKALAESLVRYLALELAPLGVRANCVAPSAVDTEALRQVYGDQTDEMMRRSAAATPSGRNVIDDDYCSLVEYLAGPSASMIQGQVVFVTGGSYLAA